MNLATRWTPTRWAYFAAVGIEKGKPFTPDARMKKILIDAAAVGDATSRTLTYQCRIKDAYFYPNSAWITPFIGGSYKFEQNGVVNLDAKALFFFYATGVTPAMTEKMVGEGSQYAGAFVDAKGNPLDGSKRIESICHPIFQSRTSGRLRRTTTRRAPCSRPINNSPPSAA
jgi:hypothetical protein